MLRIVYRICCGMDVHKSFIFACIASTNENGVTSYKSKRFSTFTGDLRRGGTLRMIGKKFVRREMIMIPLRNPGCGSMPAANTAGRATVPKCFCGVLRMPCHRRVRRI